MNSEAKQFGYNQSIAQEDKDINPRVSIWKSIIMEATFFFWDAVFCMSCYLCFISVSDSKTLNQILLLKSRMLAHLRR